MRQAGVLFAAGLLVVVAQGALAAVVPYPFWPDLGLLFVLALGLCWAPVAGGFALAAALGYASDVLSGSLLGQHAMLRMLSHAAARLGSRQLNLRGALPFAVFSAGVTVAYGLALLGVTTLFTGSGASPGSVLGRIAVHALVNAAIAPLAAQLVAWLCAVAGDDDARRGLRLGTGIAE